MWSRLNVRVREPRAIRETRRWRTAVLIVAAAGPLAACQGVITAPAAGSGGGSLPGGGGTAGGGASPGDGGGASGGSGGPGSGSGGGAPAHPPGATIDPAPPQFSCDATALPDELPLPRLSRNQLASTLRFAIARALPAESDAIWSVVAATFAQYPVDQRTPAPGDLKGGYSRGDQSIQQSQVDAMYDVSLTVARELTATGARVGALLGACATDMSTANDRSCLETFVRGWGSRVMRYAMPDADVAYFADVAGATPVNGAAVADVIVTILDSPRFLYRVENGTAAPSSPTTTAAATPLSSYELAARLSYQFWQAPPDDTLWSAAADGSLLTSGGLDTALAHVLTSPLLADATDEFVTEWLRLDELPSLEALGSDPVFRAFAGTPLPTDATRAAMIDDVRQSLRSTLSSGGSAAAFFEDRQSYTADAALAGIYGVAPWVAGGAGGGKPPTFASPARVGLLGRAALLATGTAATRPIHRGYLIRNALLCEKVGQPPPNAATRPPAPTAALTTREAVTQLTSGGSCGSCHDRAINPQGFVLEGFDALGRARSEERLFDSSGNQTASRPIDTTAVVSVGGEDWSVSSPVELARLIGDSQLFASCLARHYFRFSRSRVESSARDGCLLGAMEAAARSGQPLVEMLKATALDPTFKTRRFP
jgi:uncharacterized protein DUF1588/uncharacterized protein DUF1592